MLVKEDESWDTYRSAKSLIRSANAQASFHSQKAGRFAKSEVPKKQSSLGKAVAEKI
jgi:hypothetical protein